MSTTLITSTPDSNYPAVVDLLRVWIVEEGLSAGARLPSERDLALKFGVSRGELRRGIGYLAALGVLDVQHGVGAFLAQTPSGLGEAPLQLMRALGALTTEHLFEARKALEVSIVGLAAERCTQEQLVSIAEELTEMYASIDDADEFLVHDICFHRAIAQACGNPILQSMMESIIGGLYEERRVRVGNKENRQTALLAHRKIFHALRRNDAAAAKAAMETHLETAGNATPKRLTRVRRPKSGTHSGTSLPRARSNATPRSPEP